MKHTAKEYQRRVCLAMDFISRNLDQELSLEEIAQVASFSMFHFHRIFKAVVGETVTDFTRRLRLELAANRLLSPSGPSITQIALDCGFSSSQNFAKAFKLHFKMSPSAFQKSKLGNKDSNGENVFTLQTRYTDGLVFTHSSTKERNKSMKAEVKERPDQRVAYARKIGAYGKETCEQAFGEILHWAGPKGYLQAGGVYMMYWDNPEVTPPEKCRVDACVAIPDGIVPEGQIGVQFISGGPYAICHFEICADSFKQSWEEAFAWLVNSGYECEDKPCYEFYANDGSTHPEGKWIFDICIPLKRKP